MHAQEYSHAEEKALLEDKLRKENTAHTEPPPKQRKLAAINQMTLEESFSPKEALGHQR